MLLAHPSQSQTGGNASWPAGDRQPGREEQMRRAFQWRWGRRSGIATVALLLLGLAAAGLRAPALAALSLIMNGQVASTDVRVIGGRAYAPISDVARAMGMVAVRRPAGFEIIEAGGANQVQGALQGKVGDVLFDGKWRFQVMSVSQVPSYTMVTHSPPDYAVYHSIAEHDLGTHVFMPKPGFKLIAMRCRVVNGLREKQALWVASAEVRTALADTEGSSYPPIAYDFDGAPIQSRELLPGAKLDFVTLFSIPQGAQPKDLVFTIRNIRDKGTDVRVSLSQ